MSIKNRYVMVLSAALVAGCICSPDIEKRLAELEEQCPRCVKESDYLKPEEILACEQRIADFVQEYVGKSFGVKYPSWKVDSHGYVKLRKQFRYMSRAELSFTDDLLEWVQFVVVFDNEKYSSKAIEAESDLLTKEFAQRIGVPDVLIKERWSRLGRFRVLAGFSGRARGREIHIVIEDESVAAAVQAKKESQLPPMEGYEYQEKILRSHGNYRKELHHFNLETKLNFDDMVERAAKNDADALFALGLAFFRGDKLNENVECAEYFFKKAASAGSLNGELMNLIMSEHKHRLVSNDNNLHSVRARGADGGWIRKNLKSRIAQGEKDCYSSLDYPDVYPYTGTQFPYSGTFTNLEPLTNVCDVVAIKSKYQSLVDRGFVYASNEVARCDAWLMGYAEWQKIVEDQTASNRLRRIELEKNAKRVEPLMPKELVISSTNTCLRYSRLFNREFRSLRRLLR